MIFPDFDGIDIRRGEEKEEVTIANVLRRYLGYTSKKYNKRKLVVEALEDLYDASFYTASSRVGNSIFISFILDILDPVFCDKGYLDQALKLPFEFIFNPNFTLFKSAPFQ